MIGKKVVMAVTGVVLVGFVLVHMLGNLKIFLGPDEINAYSRFQCLTMMCCGACVFRLSICASTY